ERGFRFPKGKGDLGLPLFVGGLTLGLIFVGRGLDLEPGPLSLAFVFVVPLILVYLLQNQPTRFGLSFAMVFLAAAYYPGVKGIPTYSQRTFFGIHRVTEQRGFRKLFHGNTLHG